MAETINSRFSDVTRYRLRLFGLITGRWWPTRDLAEESAMRKGLARRDPKTGSVNFAPGLAIETSDDRAS